MVIDNLFLLVLLGGSVLTLLCLLAIFKRLNSIDDALGRWFHRFLERDASRRMKRIERTIDNAKKASLNPENIKTYTARQRHLKDAGYDHEGH